MYKVYKDYQIIDGFYMPQDQANGRPKDAAIAYVKHLQTGETRLQIIPEPTVEYWLELKGVRNGTGYKQKKEYKQEDKLEHYECKYNELIPRLYKALTGHPMPSNSYGIRQKVLSSPYVYGADISPVTRLKIEYRKHNPVILSKFNIGILDIETSVLEQTKNQILILSYADVPSKSVFCYILQSWAETTESDLMKRTQKEYAIFKENLNKKARDFWGDDGYTVHYYLMENEKDLLVKSFEKIHECRPDFIGVWNIDFDIPHIVKRAALHGLTAEDLFCDPNVPKQYRYFEYKKDKGVHAHFTDAWHRIHVTSVSQWYDAMCLYSRVRKVDGRETYYTLDYIGGKIIGTGKMSFGTNASHEAMQLNDKIGYCVYNTIDVIVPALMECIDNDVRTLVQLSSNSMIDDFSHQTAMLRDQIYQYCKNIGYILGTATGANSMWNDESDYAIGNIGGAVLNPNRMKIKGVACLMESAEPTYLHRLACDLDVTSFYPSLVNSFNISRQTKIATALWIHLCPYTLQQIREVYDRRSGYETTSPEYKKCTNILEEMTVANAEAMYSFFSRIPTVEENCISVGHDAFGLPNYQELIDGFLSS